MTRLYFMRHGESDWNVERRCIGSHDRPLTDKGRLQAAAAVTTVAALSPRPVLIAHSPLSRAQETAEIIAAQLGLPTIAIAGLREACLGVKEGADETDPTDTFERDWLAGGPIEGAELFADVGRRAIEAIEFCRSLPQAGGGPVLIVSHSAFYRAYRSAIHQPIDAVAHCSPYAH